MLTFFIAAAWAVAFAIAAEIYIQSIFFIIWVIMVFFLSSSAFDFSIHLKRNLELHLFQQILFVFRHDFCSILLSEYHFALIIIRNFIPVFLSFNLTNNNASSWSVPLRSLIFAMFFKRLVSFLKLVFSFSTSALMLGITSSLTCSIQRLPLPGLELLQLSCCHLSSVWPR